MVFWQRLAHRWLGWHYAAIQFGSGHSVGRVFEDGDSRPYLRLYGKHFDLQTTERVWYPLTFPREAVRMEVRPPKFRVISA